MVCLLFIEMPCKVQYPLTVFLCPPIAIHCNQRRKNCVFKDFDVASYIKYHDAGATKRMVKKNRMEQLFAKIHSD